jgi:hypothetical protein
VDMSSDGSTAVVAWVEFSMETFLAEVTAATATISNDGATWSAASPLAPGVVDDYPRDLRVQIASHGSQATAMWISEERSTWPFPSAIQAASATIAENLATWAQITVANEADVGYTELDLSLSADGTEAIAVWTRSLSAVWTSAVQSSSATIIGAAGTWSTPVTISTEGNGFQPKVAMSANGTAATAVWALSYSGSTLMQSATAAISSSGTTWSPIPTTHSAADADVFHPSVVMSSDATTALAVWSVFMPDDVFLQSATAQFTPAVTAVPVKGMGHWKNSAHTQTLLTIPLGTYLVDTQRKATSVFDATNCGKKGADALGCIGGHLLTTKLNIAAGADAACITAAVTHADNLLSILNYSGPAPYRLTNPQRSTAITLAATLESYNSNGCA